MFRNFFPLLTICSVIFLTLAGCQSEQEKKDVIPPTTILDEKTSSRRPQIDGSASWEKDELEKYGLSKDSTSKEIRDNQNKPQLNDIINWDQ